MANKKVKKAQARKMFDKIPATPKVAVPKVAKVEKKAPATAVKFCGCESKFQDKRYGKGKRVHNLTGGSGRMARSTKGYRCTVCGATKS